MRKKNKNNKNNCLRAVGYVVGALAVVAVCSLVWNTTRYTDSALKESVENFCDTRNDPKACRCVASAVRTVFGREKYVQYVDILRKGNEDDVKHAFYDLVNKSSVYNRKMYRVEVEDCERR